MQEIVTNNGNGHDAAQDQELLERLGAQTEDLAPLIAEDYQRGLGATTIGAGPRTVLTSGATSPTG